MGRLTGSVLGDLSQELLRVGHLPSVLQMAEVGSADAKSVAGLIASMVKTASQASKYVYERMQIWQELAIIQVIQLIMNCFAVLYVKACYEAT